MSAACKLYFRLFTKVFTRLVLGLKDMISTIQRNEEKKALITLIEEFGIF